jgi:hypothetical protein
MRWPPVSRRTHDARIRAKNEYIGRQAEHLDTALKAAAGAARVAEQLSTLKDTVALHLVAAGHPSTVVHDVTAFADSLREALAANGVDLRLELARLEGTDL